MAWQYKVVYTDFRGRISVEGEETFIEQSERRSSFARRVLNTLGAEGWELVGIQPLWPAETAYMIFKKEGEGDSSVAKSSTQEQPAPTPPAEGAPTAKLDPAPGGDQPPTGSGPVTQF
jgi:hypothetical protein